MEKARKYIKNNDLLAVPFDKVVGFSIIKKDQYEAKQLEIFQSDQFEVRNITDDSVVLKIEKEITKKPLTLKKSKDLSEHLYTKLRSTGSEPARLF